MNILKQEIIRKAYHSCLDHTMPGMEQVVVHEMVGRFEGDTAPRDSQKVDLNRIGH